MQAFCVKCKVKVNALNPIEKVNKRGLKYSQGTCPKCGIKVNRILGKA